MKPSEFVRHDQAEDLCRVNTVRIFLIENFESVNGNRSPGRNRRNNRRWSVNRRPTGLRPAKWVLFGRVSSLIFETRRFAQAVAVSSLPTAITALFSRYFTPRIKKEMTATGIYN